MKVLRVTTEIVLVDLVGFSKLSDEAQYVAIEWLEHALKNELALFPLLGGGGSRHFLLGIIPTGDGVYLLLHPALPGYGILCALALRGLLLVQIARGEAPFAGVRLAVTLGTAMPYRDITGRLNFVGNGMNACARLLQPHEEVERAFIAEFAGDENSVVASRDTVTAFHSAYPETRSEIAGFFQTIRLRISEERRTADKHGEAHAYHVVESSRHIAVLPSPPRHLSEEEIAELDRYLDRLRNTAD